MFQSMQHERAEADNRRRHVRLQLAEQSHALIRIVKLEGYEVDMNPGVILLENLSPDGCGFRTGLRFPAHSKVIYKVEWETEGKRMELRGTIRWRSKDENGYRYGLRFLPNIAERMLLTGILNRLILKTCPGQERIHRLYRSQIGADRSFGFVQRKGKF
ncbi:PilZ domain-containing protein [Cohnella faecalis]|nr:PilZ domain-containing protein [Cohnella faecalis]